MQSEDGDSIFGLNSDPEELGRWNIEQEEEAIKELKKYKCSYNGGYCVDIEEYALEYCECDKYGEFIEGSDFDLADKL